MLKPNWLCVVAVAVLTLSAGQAFAGHHSYGSYGSSGGSYGSSGGSYGSSGSSGGSYGSYGSSGGSYHHHHHHHHHHSSGSYGSMGSSGGSYGSMGSSGGSYGSYGSGGGGYIGASNEPVAAPLFAAADNRGHLSLQVPPDAIVYLADQRMTTEGSVRNYTVPGLEAGRSYRYPVRVEVVRNGTTYRGSAEPQIEAGQRLELRFQESVQPAQSLASRN